MQKLSYDVEQILGSRSTQPTHFIPAQCDTEMKSNTYPPIILLAFAYGYLFAYTLLISVTFIREVSEFVGLFGGGVGALFAASLSIKCEPKYALPILTGLLMYVTCWGVTEIFLEQNKWIFVCFVLNTTFVTFLSVLEYRNKTLKA